MATSDIPVSDATLTHLLGAAALEGRSLDEHIGGILQAAALRPDEDIHTA